MHGKVSCGEKSCINHNGINYKCKFIHIHPHFSYPGYGNMDNDEGCDRYNKEPECGQCGDWGIYLEGDKIYSCSCRNRKETLTLTFIGRDSSNRAVYDNGSGKLYVNTQTSLLRLLDSKICTKANNEFDGEPCELIPFDTEINFVPKIDEMEFFRTGRRLI